MGIRHVAMIEKNRNVHDNEASGILSGNKYGTLKLWIQCLLFYK